MEPRIYTYKITFPVQGWWYWGVHKEKTFGESYDGSPVTHSEKWEKFEYEKQILEFFEDWDEARSVEKRLIKPDLNNPMCLNENNGGGFSLEANKKGGKISGKIAGKIAVESGQLASIASKGGKIAGKIAVESGHLASIRSKGGKIGGKIAGKIAVESGQLASIASKGGKIGGKISGRKNVESGHLASISSKGGKIGGKIASKKLNSQRWKCLATGKILPPGPLTCYQKARGIDTNQRIRIND